MLLGPTIPEPKKYRLVRNVTKIQVEGYFTTWIQDETSFWRWFFNQEQRGRWEMRWIAVDKEGRRSNLYASPALFDTEEDALKFIEALKHNGQVIGDEIDNFTDDSL